MFTLIIVIPTLCYNNQFPVLELLTRRNETELREMLIKENHLRYERSLDILNQSESLLLQSFNLLPKMPLNFQTKQICAKTDDPNADTHKHFIADGIAITIITLSRDKRLKGEKKTHYLLQSVAEFLTIINRTNPRYTVHLSVCNVDPNPEEYDDVKHLPTWLPVYSRLLHDKQGTKSVSGLSAILDKEKTDYVFCMKKALEQNLSYVLLVEDDALPHNDLFNVLETFIWKYNRKCLSDLEQVLYIKLYHPERLLGYISLEFERIPELISMAVLCAAVLTRIYTRWKPRTSLAAVFTTFTLISISVLLFIGRANIVELRRLSRYLYQITPAPSCCTPAMLFPRQSAIITSNYLQTIHCKKDFGKDIALDKFVRKHGHKTRYIQPNLFRHVGHYSSLRSDFINPYIVA